MAKWALITGGTRGIGQKIAKFVAQKGYSVIITYRKSINEAENFVNSLKNSYGIDAKAYQITGSDPEKIKNLFQKIYDCGDRVDLLVNNAGDYIKTSLETLTIPQWQTMIEQNLNIPYIWCHTYLPYAVTQTYGRIINIGYVNSGASVAKTLITPYYIAKSGLWQLTLAIAKQYAPYNITANMISPGIMENSDTKPMMPPVGYYGDPEELAESIELLISPKGRYITGSQINFCGGWGL